MKNLKSTILATIIAMGFYANATAQEKAKAKANEAYRKGAVPESGEVISSKMTIVFNNGCTRTCSGDWSTNPSGTVSCDGEAGPLICPEPCPASNNISANKVILKNQALNPDGTIALKEMKEIKGMKKTVNN